MVKEVDPSNDGHLLLKGRVIVKEEHIDTASNSLDSQECPSRNVETLQKKTSTMNNHVRK